jgi:hypothetical protein
MSRTQKSFEGPRPIVLVVDDNPAIRDMFPGRLNWMAMSLPKLPKATKH